MVDAVIVVVTGSIACDGVVTGIGEADATPVVVADSVACNSVIVAG